jgi:hypothetical protein
MLASSGPGLVVLLAASALLGANAARIAAARPDARFALIASGLVALVCAWLAALEAAASS